MVQLDFIREDMDDTSKELSDKNRTIVFGVLAFAWLHLGWS